MHRLFAVAPIITVNNESFNNIIANNIVCNNPENIVDLRPESENIYFNNKTTC